jgi:hypothetical protein
MCATGRVSLWAVTVSGDAPHWQTLGRVIRQRREDLRLRQSDLESLGGPSDFTVRNLETARRKKYRSSTLRRVESVLRFPSGAFQGVLDGTIVEGSPQLVAMVAGHRHEGSVGDAARDAAVREDAQSRLEHTRQLAADTDANDKDALSLHKAMTKENHIVPALRSLIAELEALPQKTEEEQAALEYVMEAWALTRRVMRLGA